MSAQLSADYRLATPALRRDDQLPAHPFKLLSAHTEPEIPTSIVTMHWHSLFEGPKNQLYRRLASSFKELQQAGHDGIYLLGAFSYTPISLLLQDFHCRVRDKLKQSNPDRRYLRGSVFSMEELNPDYINWKELQRVAHIAEKHGIKIILDFVPHSTGLGSLFARNNPDAIVDFGTPCTPLKDLWGLMRADHLFEQAPQQLIKLRPDPYPHELHELLEYNVKYQGHPRTIFHYRIFGIDRSKPPLGLYEQDKKSGKYKLAPNEETPLWEALVQRGQQFLDYTYCRGISDPHAKWHCKRLTPENGTTFCDMLKLNDSEKVFKWQQRYLYKAAKATNLFRVDLAHQKNPEYLARLRNQASADGLDLRFILEVYGNHSHYVELGFYPYAKYFYDYLKDPSGIGNCADYLKFQGGDFCPRNQRIGFAENHDDERLPYAPQAGAAQLLVVAAPFESVLWAQGRGLTTYKFSADIQPSRYEMKQLREKWRQADPGLAEFMARVEQLAGLAVFRSRKSEFRVVDLITDSGLTRHNDPRQVLGLVRSLKLADGSEEQVLVVINGNGHQGDMQLTYDLSQCFRKTPAELEKYRMVNLLKNEVRPAFPQFSLWPTHQGGFDSFAYALIRCEDRAPELLSTYPATPAAEKR